MIVWCQCPAFSLWYEENGNQVCRCGHRAEEHLDMTRSCIGDSEEDE